MENKGRVSRRYCEDCHNLAWGKKVTVEQDTTLPVNYGQHFFYDEKLKCKYCISGEIRLKPPGHGASTIMWESYWKKKGIH